MRDAGEDWLSCTMRTVNTVMERHGFEEDAGRELAPSPGSAREEKLSAWNKLLRVVTLFGSSE